MILGLWVNGPLMIDDYKLYDEEVDLVRYLCPSLLEVSLSCTLGEITKTDVELSLLNMLFHKDSTDQN